MKQLTFNTSLIILSLVLLLSCKKNTEDLKDQSVKEDETFNFVEQLPEFPGGPAAMTKFINDNMRYPEEAKLHKVAGTVVIQFVVTKEGKIINVTLTRGIGYGCDEEALRVIQSMPDWKPGKYKNKEVPVNFTLPVKFKL
ncbi:MAG: energy transducer TonB [Saprospiraceae bacterium]|nr:energy transducer TonB [Candidatus Defluviibacterium haderslevense]